MSVLIVPSYTQELHHGVPAVLLHTADKALTCDGDDLVHLSRRLRLIVQLIEGEHHNCIETATDKTMSIALKKACSSGQNQRLAPLGVGGRPELCVCWANALAPERVL